MRYESVKIELETFHPSFRDVIDAEMKALLAETPPFGEGRLTVTSGVCYRESSTGELKSMHNQGYAVTSRDNLTNAAIITFNGTLYGVDGDLDELKRLHDGDDEADFHGTMKCWQKADLAHEYGHVIEGCLHHVFLAEAVDIGCVVTNRWRKLAELGRNTALRDSLGELVHMRRGLVSGYASHGEAEFFAETFAARRWASPEDRELPTVRMLDELLGAAYEAARRMGIVYAPA